MSLRSTYTRLGIALAAGSLVALAGATPALADDDWGPGSDDSRASFGEGGDRRFDNGDEGLGDDPNTTRGTVDRNGGLFLRSRPDPGSRLVRIARNGETVRIFCQTWGDRDDDLWYLIADGTWSWGPARFIDTSSTPPWC
ncbi:SH3 domain-containing protein [Streptomyces sp. R41]|uniref:SH3 domain-containing protein n=1 Tax=Streptomyces sp. R41 TaxID=3238632 RepID=A0AB39RMP5_9ACTN